MPYSATRCNAIRRRAIDRYRITIIDEFALLPLSSCFSSFFFLVAFFPFFLLFFFYYEQALQSNEHPTMPYVTISTIELSIVKRIRDR